MYEFIIFVFVLILILIIISEIILHEINSKYDGQMEIDGHKFKTESLHKNTDVVHLKNFLSSEECRHIINIAEGNFKRSTTVDEPRSKGRTSFTCFLNRQKDFEDKTLQRINKRVATYLNIDPCQIEDLQVVRYTPGQKYDYHYDWFKDANLGPDGNEGKKGGQRLYTIFVYLNTLNEEGNNGSTCFKHLDICTSPIEGNGVYWTNLKDGKGDHGSLHAGVAPKKGVKYGLNIWVREKCFVR